MTVDKEQVRAANRLEEVVPVLLGLSISTKGREPAVRCPFHEDHTPSLRLNPEKQVWRCDPCGFGGDVFELVQRVRGVGFADAVTWLAERGGIAKPKSGGDYRVVEHYDYRTLDGELRYQIERREPKAFRQRRPDAKGGWIWNMDGERLLVYRWPELKGREAVAIVGGEKDANTLWKVGIPATTNSGGETKWTDDHTAQLKEAGIQRILIIPDNDDKGRQHADIVGRSCSAAGLNVRVLTLPDMPAKGDVSDYMQSHSREELIALMKTAPSWTAPSAPAATPIPSSAPTPATPKSARNQKAQTPGQSLDFEELEPWPNPVNLAELLTALRVFLLRFAVISAEAADAVVLWIAHTYLMVVWRTSPFMVPNSPTKQCGKTRLLEVVSALVFRPIPTSNITPPALFRVIDKFTPTLLFDEAENWITDKQSELRGLLNAGHTRRTAWAMRTVGDKHDVSKFSTWAPKFIALIGRLPDTMMDRSIVIPMRRKRKEDKVEVLLEHRLVAEALPLRRQLERFATDAGEQFRDVVPEPPQGLRDRAVDNWSPLFAIADFAGGDWPKCARTAAAVLSGGAEAADDSNGLKLLEDCYSIWVELGRVNGVIASAELVKRLNKLPDRPWGDMRGREGISSTWLASQLRDFDVVTAGNVRYYDEGKQKQSKGYRWATFFDAWDRYLIVEAYQRTNPNEIEPEPANSTRPSEQCGTDAKTRVEPTNPDLWDTGTVAGRGAGDDDGWGDV